jgi:hypothetical protein
MPRKTGLLHSLHRQGFDRSRAVAVSERSEHSDRERWEQVKTSRCSDPICSCWCNPVGTRYFTSVQRKDGRTVALSGPYYTHQEALDALSGDRARAWDADPRGPWYSYGTFAVLGGQDIRPVFEKGGD